MSYQMVHRPIPMGPGYEIDSHQNYPLSYGMGQMPPAPPVATGFGGAGITLRQVLMGIVCVVVAVLVVRYLMKLAEKSQKVERNSVVQRISTKELAQRLYERLEKRGRANPATMRSLERLSR